MTDQKALEFIVRQFEGIDKEDMTQAELMILQVALNQLGWTFELDGYNQVNIVRSKA